MNERIFNCYYAGPIAVSESPVFIHARFLEKARPDYVQYQIIEIVDVFHGEFNVESAIGTHVTRGAFREGSYKHFITARTRLHDDLVHKADDLQKWVNLIRKEAETVAKITEPKVQVKGGVE